MGNSSPTRSRGPAHPHAHERDCGWTRARRVETAEAHELPSLGGRVVSRRFLEPREAWFDVAAHADGGVCVGARGKGKGRGSARVYRLPASGGVEYLGLCPRGAATACASTTTAACASTTTATCASTTTLCASVLQDPQKGFKLPEKGGVFESFQRSNTYLKCEQGRE